jgi:outer membrane receptor for ferrienterochelin and colicin
MQLAENGFLFMNLGWYVQYPLFDYLYTGLDRVALARGLGALTGNPDLAPERTKAWEISLRYSFAFNIVCSVTYFRKETSNQVDAKTFVPGDSKVAGNFGFAEYVNNPFASATGLEIVVARERGKWLLGELSYTYMVAEGMSGSAQDGFYVAQYGLLPGTRLYPLSWDQRHAVKAVTSIITPWNFNVHLVVQWHSGRPYTNYPTSTGFEKIDGGRFNQNNDRMPAYRTIDVRVDKFIALDVSAGATLACFIDVRNLLNTKNVQWMDSNGRIGGELNDPSGYSIGRRTNVGVRFDF